jgi:hypothetical protein
MKSWLKVTGIIFLFSFQAFGAFRPTSISIDPIVVNYDSLPDLNKSILVNVGLVEDSTLNTSGNIGQTRTGYKLYAPIVCKTSPALSTKKSLENMLSKKGIFASDPSAAKYVIDIVIRSFSLKETSKFLTQTMDASVKFEVTITDPLDASKKRKFSVETTNSKTALDTTKYAEEVIQTALRNVLLEILKSL